MPQLERAQSIVTGGSGLVFAKNSPFLKKPANADEFYVLAKIVSQANGVFTLRQKEPAPTTADEDVDFQSNEKSVYNTNPPYELASVPDIGNLPHSNTLAILDLLVKRYKHGYIYTFADPLCVAINPYTELGLTTNKIVQNYRNAPDVWALPPHVFVVARQALSNMYAYDTSQTIVVSGESGAGKTEATKHVMKFFATQSLGAEMDLRIQNAVMTANPVLESFGNAKTLRNNNSSRFGRFMQLDVAAEGGIRNGRVRNFLLERSRVTSLAENERSYHIFYQLILGADATLKSQLKIKDFAFYNSLKGSKSHSIPGVHDAEDFNVVNLALVEMGFNKDEILSVMKILAGILLMGNVEFTEVAEIEGASLKDGSQQILNDACDLIGLNPTDVKFNLTNKKLIAGGQDTLKQYSGSEAQFGVSSLCRGVYNLLFEYIVRKLNTLIEPPSKQFKQFIGMLDIFGFEVFPDNSLEQLLINITNELLQSSFVDAVFTRENRLYKSEGVSLRDLQYSTNKEVCDVLIDAKPSLLSLLNDQSQSPEAHSSKPFMNQFMSNFQNNSRVKPIKTHIDRKFIIIHSIGEIQYDSMYFILKNKEVFSPAMAELTKTSSNIVTKALLDDQSISGAGQLEKNLYISKLFTDQVKELIGIINTTEAHFIRCVKPNEEKKALVCNNAKVFVQLHALSVFEAIELRKAGYSYRRPYDKFVQQFHQIAIGEAQHPSKTAKEKTLGILKATGIPQKDPETGSENWAVGKTMVFMKAETVRQIQKANDEALRKWKPLVQLTEAAWIKKKNRASARQKQIKLVRFQAHCKKYIECKKMSISVVNPPK